MSRPRPPPAVDGAGVTAGDALGGAAGDGAGVDVEGAAVADAVVTALAGTLGARVAVVELHAATSATSIVMAGNRPCWARR